MKINISFWCKVLITMVLLTSVAFFFLFSNISYYWGAPVLYEKTHFFSNTANLGLNEVFLMESSEGNRYALMFTDFRGHYAADLRVIAYEGESDTIIKDFTESFYAYEIFVWQGPGTYRVFRISNHETLHSNDLHVTWSVGANLSFLNSYSCAVVTHEEFKKERPNFDDASLVWKKMDDIYKH